MVSIGLLVFATLTAPRAGSEGETGTGAVRVAAELAGTISLPARTCAESAPMHHRELVFEVVKPGDIDEQEIQRLSMTGREVVSFEWHAATGELSYNTTAPTAMFSDLAPWSPPGAGQGRSCESR